MSTECKRVLDYAVEEAGRLSHKHVGTEHLLLGLLREEKCLAAEILHERGLHLSIVREELAHTSQEIESQIVECGSWGNRDGLTVRGTRVGDHSGNGT